MFVARSLFHRHARWLLALQYRQYSKYPPHMVLPMPALSPTMTQGNIGAWRKKIGERVKPGDVLVEIETDKATMDFECQEEGYLARQLQPEGTKDFAVGQPLAVLAERKDDVKAFADFVAKESVTDIPKEKTEKIEPAPPQDSVMSATARIPDVPVESGRVIASPVAKAMAKESGLNLTGVKGTGPNQRIVKADVAQAMSQAPAATMPASTPSSGSAFVEVPVSSMRRVIAQRLSESKQTIPHYYLTTEICMDRIVALRTELNELGAGDYKLSLNDFIIKAAALALKAMPSVNASWQGNVIRQYHTADICVAVATEAGLITPMVAAAESKGLAAISREMKELAALAKQNRLQPAQYQGGSFTISNLGMYGISHFTAIINPPQACILAVGATQPKPVVSPDGQITVAQQMAVTLSCDHRVVDGAMGAQWLAKFKAFLEDPNTMLL